MTIERFDGANLFQLLGVRADTIDIAGAVGAMNTATMTLFAQDRPDAWAGPLTPALPARTPTFMEGWQTRLWVGAYGGTPQSILMPNAMINWDLKVSNALGRKYTANNTKVPSAITFGELAVAAKLTLRDVRRGNVCRADQLGQRPQAPDPRSSSWARSTRSRRVSARSRR